jgi:uncharacterized cupin superfamily protein
MQRVNVLAPVFDLSSAREGYEWHAMRVDSEQMAARLYELEGDQRSNPYHFHHAIEEWVLVIAGAPVVRTPDGERVLKPGDVLCFPVGPEGAHEVKGPGTVLIVSDRRTVDSIEYPDRGEIAVFPPGKVFRTADALERP